MSKVNEVVDLLKDAIAKIEAKNEESEEKTSSKNATSIQNDLKRAFPSLSGGGKRFSLPTKKGKQSDKRVFVIQPKDSWTHDFFLLSESNQSISPNIDEAAILGEAGLGRRKIIFPNKNGKFEEFKNVLEREYPKMKSQEGAFELLRAESGGMSRPLRLLPMPADGYSIPYLRTLVSNSTLIYIRPIASCISKEKVKQEVTSSSPLSKCPTCGIKVAIFNLREHVSICQAVSDGSDDDLEVSVFNNTSSASKSKPKVKDGHPVDNPQPSSSCGTSFIDGSDDDLEVSVFSNTSSTSISKPKVKDGHPVDNPQPSSSCGTSFIDDGIASLSGIFPDEGLDSLRDAMMKFQDIEMAAEALSSKLEVETIVPCQEKHDESDVHGGLEGLKANMNSSLSAETLRVDEEDIVFDFFRYYKSPKFDPKVPIAVRYRNQPGVDAGGLLRQAFCTVFKMISANEVHQIRLFTGPPNRVTPVYSSDNILTKTFETLGKMVAHSLLQDGPGFPYLAPAVYWYVATGDLNEAVSRASFTDVVDPDLKAIVDKVKDDNTIGDLNKDDTLISLLQECGEVRTLTESNKSEIMQTLILHSTVVKHKASLDQFRKGLEILGVLSEIEKAPGKYEHFFVHSEEEITAEFVKSLLKLPDMSNPVVENSVGMLNTFLDRAKKEDLASFLSFTTGSKLNTGAFKAHCINVSVHNMQGFFASTCTLELKIPSDVLSYPHFELLLKSVMNGDKFTTV